MLIFYVDELLLERLTFCARDHLSGSFGCGCAPANRIGCQFHGYFVLYTNLSFKEMSWIERGAYNRRHNMRSHMLMHTIRGVGIISPAMACGCTLRSPHTSQNRHEIRQYSHMYNLESRDVVCVFKRSMHMWYTPTV